MEDMDAVEVHVEGSTILLCLRHVFVRMEDEKMHLAEA